MRYAPDHSAKTRQRVITQAAAAIRKNGPDGVSVATIMRKAGLTHGGFYAHFGTKDDLVAAALGHMFDDSASRSRSWTKDRVGADAFAAFVHAYVSPEHRDRPESGCAIAALASQIPRENPKIRNAFDSGVEGLVEIVESLLPRKTGRDTRAVAMSMMAEMTGAIAAARAVRDRALSDAILEATRKSLIERADWK